MNLFGGLDYKRRMFLFYILGFALAAPFRKLQKFEALLAVNYKKFRNKCFSILHDSSHDSFPCWSDLRWGELILQGRANFFFHVHFVYFL